MKRTIMISTGITRTMGETSPADVLLRTADTLDAMVQHGDVSVVDLRYLPSALNHIATMVPSPRDHVVTLTQEDMEAMARLIRAARDAFPSIEEEVDFARFNLSEDEAAEATARAKELRDAITGAEHALGLPPSDGWEGDRDNDGAPLRYKNHYKCDCGAEWDDEWSCTCDDRCPSCDTACSPEHSIDLMEMQEAAHGND